ncbi:S9 family peptidase [Porticoccaceae bacterium]|nr:S9 family peptidase [Porticoccaceae bacterium]
MLKKRKDNNAMEARYQRAQALMHGMHTKNIALNATLFPHWIGESDCFWYERETKTGKQYRLVDAKKATNEIAFDHTVLGHALAKASGQTINADDLPITAVMITLSPLEVSFSAFGKQWVFEDKAKFCKEVETTYKDKDWVISPDGKLAAFVRDFNLWVINLESGEERALTLDGEEFYVYAIVGEGWGQAVDSGVQLQWSPDSKRIFTVQRDTRQVKTLPVVHHVPTDGSLRPSVTYFKISYPGDEHVPEYRLVVITVESGECREAKYRRIPVCRNGWGFFNAGLGWWATDSRRAYFVDQERGDQVIRVVELDAHTGVTRVLFEETSDTQINISANSEDYPLFLALPETSELIWWSERSGWAHLYLYDLETGEFKPITEGDWLVRDVLHFDAECRELFVQTAARVPDRDPYYRDLCRIHVDTGEITTLISSDHEYLVITQKADPVVTANAYGYDVDAAAGVSPSGHFAVVTRTRADEVPVSLLLDRNGKEILKIETADVSALSDGWQWPEPVKLLAADGKTDIYGLIFRPSDFSPDKKYPVVNHVFNCPDVPWVAKGSFSSGGPFFGISYFDAAALAELGFIVVNIDGRGSPYRYKAFQDESHGRSSCASFLEDHVAGIRQLAKRYPYMDLERVGITTHTMTGSGAARGLLEYPDFYKVGVNGCLHDSRLMAASMWGDKYDGVSGPATEHEYPEQLVGNLQGKLLLMHGMIDVPCPPAGTFRLVEALVRAGKDFDMLLLPNLAHSMSSYVTRRGWDYLVKYLLGIEPPKEFKLTIDLDILMSTAETDWFKIVKGNM